jgi:hypothetical protein
MTWIGIGNTIGRRRGGATPPDAPTGLAATVVSDSQIDLSWDAVEGATSYKVYYGTDGVTFPYSTTSTTNSKNVTGLNAYTRYYFKISALNGTLEGDASDSVNDWTAWKGVLTSTGDGSGVSAIRLYFQTTNVVATLDGTGKFYSDSGGTTDESSTYTFVAGDLRTRYLKVPSGTSNLLIFAKGNWLKFGNDAFLLGWASSTNAASLAFTLTGMPVMTHLSIAGTSTITGALPTGLTFLRLVGNSIAWTYNGALPTGLTYLRLYGSSIAWTGLDIGNNGNITYFNLDNYRITKMSSADMVTLLTQMKNRTGSLPATVTINDYADYASPPSEVTDAVAALKAAKSITTVNLGA